MKVVPWYIVLNEIAYGGNIGFEEMTRFYLKASPAEIKQMEAITKAGDWDAFRKIINKVVGVKLK